MRNGRQEALPLGWMDPPTFEERERERDLERKKKFFLELDATFLGHCLIEQLGNKSPTIVTFYNKQPGEVDAKQSFKSNKPSKKKLTCLKFFLKH